MISSELSWAREQFGDVDLGDPRRERRLMRVAADAARSPSGSVSGTTKGAARREAAFRLVENDLVDPQAIGEASWRATLRRCASEQTVIVPIDGCTVSLSDSANLRGLGPVGGRVDRARGIHVMNSMAVTRDGIPMGLLDQCWWVRQPMPRARRKKKDRRPREQRESHFWVKAIRATVGRVREHAPGCIPWLQLDRGGDCRGVLELARDERLMITLRACYSRRLKGEAGEVRRYLFEELGRQKIAGYYEIDVPGRLGQKPRHTRMAVRFLQAPIAVPLTQHRRSVVVMHAISAEEVRPPAGQKPLKWTLLTTRPVEHLVDALQVVAAYSLRWRIEDFHKTWKSGACDIESSQLRACDHFVRWATIMAAVATRIERLKHLSREQPQRPATDEFSQDEIDAAILLRKQHTRVPYERGDVPTLGEMTRYIADFGGYMGSKNSKPPGATVLRRGLEYVAGGAEVLGSLRRGSG